MTELRGLAECPHCATRMRGPRPPEPRTVGCARCKEAFLLRPQDVALDAVPGLEPQAIHPIVLCPYCDGRIRIPNVSAIYSCKHCDQSVLVPPEALAPSEDHRNAVRDEAAPEPEQPAREPQSPLPAHTPAPSASPDSDVPRHAPSQPASENDKPHASRVKLWLARFALVWLTFLCMPLVVLGQELIATMLPVTRDWGTFVAVGLGLIALYMVIMLWEKATRRYAPHKEPAFSFFTGLTLPVGILLKNPKGDASREFAVVQHGLGVEPGRFVIGFQGHDVPDAPVTTLAVEGYLPFADIRRIGVRVIPDEELQNAAVGDALVSGFVKAVSRHRLPMKMAVGAEITVSVERAENKVEEYVLGIPADVSASRIQLLAMLVDTTAPAVEGDTGISEQGVGVNAAGVAKAYAAIANVLEIDNLSTTLASGVEQFGSVAGFIGSIASASRMTNRNAGLAAALIASAIQLHAPHAVVARD